MLEERRREAERSRIAKKEMKRVKSRSPQKRPRGRSVDHSRTILAHTEVEESHIAMGGYNSQKTCSHS